jgi:hypothetical protein
MERTTSIPLLSQLEEALRESEVTERGDLLRLTASLLKACSAAGFRRVDHWEIRPGGWLPLRPLPRGPQVEPVAQFVASLGLDQWKAFANAREFACRLSGTHGNRVALVLRRVHRERTHTISVDLAGFFAGELVERLVDALHRQLPVLRAKVTAFLPAERRARPASPGRSVRR